MSAEGGSLFPATLRKAFSRSFLGPVEVGSLVPRSEVPKSLLLPTSKLTSSEGPPETSRQEEITCIPLGSAFEICQELNLSSTPHQGYPTGPHTTPSLPCPTLAASSPVPWNFTPHAHRPYRSLPPTPAITLFSTQEHSHFS